jgi:hypothetical protein
MHADDDVMHANDEFTILVQFHGGKIAAITPQRGGGPCKKGKYSIGMGGGGGVKT